jgi:hypothetical protein
MLAVHASPVHSPSAPRPPQKAISTDSGSPITQYVTWGARRAQGAGRGGRQRR